MAFVTGLTGQPQEHLHPAAAAYTDPSTSHQTQAVWPLGSREEHSGGVFEVWHLTEFLQEEKDQADQPCTTPSLTSHLQTCR